MMPDLVKHRRSDLTHHIRFAFAHHLNILLKDQDRVRQSPRLLHAAIRQWTTRV